MKSFPVILGLALITSIQAQSQDQPLAPPQGDKTFAPKLVFTPNELLKYKFMMNMNMSMKTSGGKPLPFPLGEMKMDTTLRMKTAGVKPDGSAVIVVNTSGGKMSMMGNTADMPEGQTSTMEIDPRGRIKQMNTTQKGVPGTEMLEGLFKGNNFNNMPGFGVLLPDHPVKVGESWEVDTPTPFGGKMHISNTLLGIETVDGKETLKVKQVMMIPFDMKLGQGGIVKNDSEAFMVMTGSMGGNSIQNIQESNGRIIKTAGEMTGKIAMEMKGEAAKQAEQQGIGSTIDMEITGTLGMNLLSAGTVQPAPIKPATKKPATAVKRSKG